MRKIIYIILIAFSILLLGCADKTNNNKEVSFNDNENKNEYFETINKIKIDINNADSTKIYSAIKLFEVNDTSLFILDVYSSSLYMISNQGRIMKKIGGKGNGPGEFQFVSDFTLDNLKNIYVLDGLGGKVGKFDSTGKFIKNYFVSFTQRIPWKIQFFNNQFIISAEKNLSDGSTSANYDFLDYSDISYLNVYDNNFKYKFSFFHPVKKLENTQGILNREWDTFAPFTIIKNSLIASQQDGFYALYLFNNNYKTIKEINVKTDSFKNINLNEVKGIKILSNKMPNISEEKIGKIIGNHSVPLKIFYDQPYLLIEVRNPLPNYFPEYAKDYNPTFHIDVFAFDNGELKPLISNIANQGRLIGIGKNHCFYFEVQNSKNIYENKYFFIYKKKLKL